MKGLFLFLSLIFVSCELQVIDNSREVLVLAKVTLEIDNINMIGNNVYVDIDGIESVFNSDSSVYDFYYETFNKSTDIYVFVDVDNDGVCSAFDYVYQGTIHNYNQSIVVVDDWTIKKE